MMKCEYCGKECLDSFCDDRCESSYARSVKRAERYKNTFFICFILSLSPLVLMFLGNEYDRYVISLPLIFLGMTAIVFPFATPETYDSFSIKNATIAIRSIGAIVCIVGAILMFIIG
jgi:predicted nucleic acid-binding Zn ribbon protein